MKRKKLEPLPLPPEGYAFNANGFIRIEEITWGADKGICEDDVPNWTEDPTYNLRSSKYGKVKHR